MELIAAALIGLFIFTILPKQASQVTLLPDADGKVGAVIITSTRGDQQRLDSAYTAVSISDRGGMYTRPGQAGDVRARYAATLDARPAPPVTFTVYFESGSAVDVRPTLQPMLQELRAALPNYPAPEIMVTGHTDRMGTLESNDELSLQRAMTVRQAMVDSGIDAALIDVAGRGEREPIVATTDEVPEARNRRVEISLR